jgi:hypothetical protein
MTLSYHNDPAVKARHVALAKHHYEADMLLAGTYACGSGSAFKGCSVGCMAHDIAPNSATDYHAIVAADAGWPDWLVRLNDSIFEGLPKGDRERFHVQLREAVPVGVDLEPVQHLLAVRRLIRLESTLALLVGKHGAAIDDVITQTLAALAQMKKCHEAQAASPSCSVSSEDVARAAAWAAARAAAEAAAEAARAAAWAAAWAARAAAWAARAAATTTTTTTTTAAWKAERDDLLAILTELSPT